MAYGARQYGSHARVLVAADLVAPPTSNLAGTAARTRTGSLALTIRHNIGGTAARTRTGSLAMAQTAYATTWDLDLSQSGYRERDAHLSLSTLVAVTAPPASVGVTYIKKVIVDMPLPTLGQYGRPE